MSKQDSPFLLGGPLPKEVTTLLRVFFSFLEKTLLKNPFEKSC